mmetsp:Transcript_145546/g.362939  ORF Transcript_145546/g.362939 Transcript_145546/m.362939 type:complete len:695 (+) Transcript_145546:3-2087(+)
MSALPQRDATMAAGSAAFGLRAMAGSATPIPAGQPMALEPPSGIATVSLADATQRADGGAGGAGIDAAASSVQPMEEDDDDPVVQECDVYLNRMHDPPDFVGDMYVVQYPLRPTYRPYGDQGDLDSVWLKQKGRRLKFVYKLAQSDNYDGDSVISDKLGKRNVLSSTVVANTACSYAIGVIHQGRMTITPIRAVNQLRPDFEDYDRVRAQSGRGSAAASSAAPAEGAKGGDSSGESGAEDPASNANVNEVMAAPVRVEYQPNARRAKDSGPAEVGGAEKVPEEPEEPWVRLDYYDRNSAEALDVYQQHFIWPAAAAAQAEQDEYEPEHPKLQALELDRNREVLLAQMCGNEVPASKRKQALDAAKPQQEGPSVYVLSKMPVERQVEALARHFIVMSYSKQLRKRLPPSTIRSHGTDEELLHLLRRVAVLVAGNWVLKTELAGHEGMEAYARDMLLVLFAKKNGILQMEEYEKWINIFQNSISQSMREEITRAVAEREGSAIRLRNRADDDFNRKFPKLAQEYSTFWDKFRIETVKKMQSADRSNASRQNQAAQSQAQRHRSRMLTEVREALAVGAMTLPELRRRIQKKSPNVPIREEDLHLILQTPELEAVKIRDLWLCGRTGVEANDKFRSVMHGLFRSKDTVTVQEIQDEYERAHGHKCNLSSYIVRGFMREIAEKLEGDTWVLKNALSRNT